VVTKGWAANGRSMGEQARKHLLSAAYSVPKSSRGQGLEGSGYKPAGWPVTLGKLDYPIRSPRWLMPRARFGTVEILINKCGTTCGQPLKNTATKAAESHEPER